MRTKSYTERVAKKSHAPKKAGVMLYEDTPAGRKLLVTYNEGRYSKNGEFYVLPKGSVDEGETTLHAGIRELGEETGFDLLEFLGADNVAKLEKGKVLRNITNPDYPGFKIVEFDPKEFHHTYCSRTGNPQPMVMYGVKVEGLDTLSTHLKNPERITTKQLLDANPQLPRFPVFFDWLKQGRIPADGSTEQIRLCDPVWFAGKIGQYAPNGVIREEGDWQQTRDDWQQFCKTMEQNDRLAYMHFCEAVGTISATLKERGLIAGDTAILKFDEKDCPLFWYVEGGHIGYSQDILTKTFRDIHDANDYARAFGGQGTDEKNLTPAEIMERGQVAAYDSFVSPAVIRSAMLEAYGVTGALADAFIRNGAQRARAAEVRRA